MPDDYWHRSHWSQDNFITLICLTNRPLFKIIKLFIRNAYNMTRGNGKWLRQTIFLHYLWTAWWHMCKFVLKLSWLKWAVDFIILIACYRWFRTLWNKKELWELASVQRHYTLSVSIESVTCDFGTINYLSKDYS